MQRFIERFQDKIIGTLSGFDRLVLRGTLRAISHCAGMREFLWQNGVLLKNFQSYVEPITERLRKLSQKIAQEAGRPFQYVASANADKEKIALRLLEKHPTKEGLVCILNCVEPGKSFELRSDRETKKLRLHIRDRMCLHTYHYMIHPSFGWINARFQTWFPFNIQICLNGREWLSRSMDQLGMKYSRLDNCFPDIENLSRAQELMNKQLQTNWPQVLSPIAALLNPIHQEIFHKIPLEYYWSTVQSEWATDIMFKNPAELALIYRALVPHALTSFSSADVVRFLGRKFVPNRHGEVHTDYKRRFEGVRIKHSVDTNSVKMYDKFGILLRIETTINNPRPFVVLRPVENQPEKTLAWQRLRQGIADIHRRSQVSFACNQRYLDALAAVDTSIPLGQLIDPICRSTTYNGKRIRALQPWSSDDFALFSAVCDGRFSINGFRNRDLQSLLYNCEPFDLKEKRRRSGRVTRLLRMLRAHHLIKKVPKTYRYHLTSKGNQILRALLSMHNISLEQFNRLAA